MARKAHPPGARSAAGEPRDDKTGRNASRSGDGESPIEAQIDELYQLPLDAFTNARNTLAKTLSTAGDKPAAARVKALAKPTVIPWAVNQVYWQAQSIWTRLLEAGRELRAAQVQALERPGSNAAQAERVREQLREATAAHRQAVADAVHQAVRAATQAKVNPQTDLLARMLDALSLAPPDRPGRLTEVVQPAGFEALLGVTPVAAPALPESSRAKSAGDRAPGSVTRIDRKGSGVRRPSAETAAVERQRAEQLRAAKDALAAAQTAQDAAQAEADAARAAVEDAELRVVQAKAALKSAESELKTATAARTAAEADLRRLEQRK